MHGFAGQRASRDNVFDAVRLLAALAVLISHSFSIAGERQPHIGGFQLGIVGVWVFFGISGYLIAQSWSLDPHLPRFLAKRALRIIPALLVALLLTTLLLGPALTALPLADYFSRSDTWVYLVNNAVFNTAHELPGVFGDNPTPREVNASIHTLRPEVWAYLGVAALGVAGALRGRWVAPAVALALWLAPHQDVVALPHEIQWLQAFAVGSALYVLRDRVPWRPPLAAGAIACWLLAPEGLQLKLAVIAIPYASILLGQHGPRVLQRLTAHGDFSYGIYVFAWPIGQTLVHFFDGLGPAAVMAISLPLTYAIGAASWHLIEQPALRHKRRLTNPTHIARPDLSAPEAVVVSGHGRFARHAADERSIPVAPESRR